MKGMKMLRAILALTLPLFLLSCQGGIAGSGDTDTDDPSPQDGQESADSLSDPAEEPRECSSSEECDDANPCNGEETCNLESHRCVDGLPPASGTVCGTLPRMICLEGSCVESVCGDGFVDVEAGESCEPPAEGDCNDDCSQACDGNEDCDDFNPCTNDLCDGGSCSRSYVPDGTSCGEGLFCCSGECVQCCTSGQCTGGLQKCCGGQCRACCIDTDCDDTISCTEDTCTGYLCSHTDMPDLSPCPGGICCSALCRVGGGCCTSAQCTDGCKGTSRACRDVPGDSCSGQVGCFGTGENYCAGTPQNCTRYSGLLLCEACGCGWTMIACGGNHPTPCASLDIEYCEDCGCDGVHEACGTYTDQTTCDTQLDCYWSTCLEYLCT